MHAVARTPYCLYAQNPLCLGRYAFGLEETNYSLRAEAAARDALYLQKKTPFAAHVIGEGEGAAHM